ncbi:MAG: hypothetical protein JSS60_02725 [Verrucomicrobia bacterium]|nr:hypothetical protein [Verrucomicrobiota bacterium]
MGINTGNSSNIFNLPGNTSQYILSDDAHWDSKKDTVKALRAYNEAWANLETVKICVSQLPITKKIEKKFQEQLSKFGERIFEQGNQFLTNFGGGLLSKLKDLQTLDETISRNEEQKQDVLKSQWNEPVFRRVEFDIQPGEYRLKLRDANQKPYSDYRDVQLEKLEPRIDRQTNFWLKTRMLYNQGVVQLQDDTKAFAEKMEKVVTLSEHVRTKMLPKVAGQRPAPAMTVQTTRQQQAPLPAAQAAVLSQAALQPASVAVTVEFDAGLGNSLVLCGQGGGLSWKPEEGKPMTWTPGNKWECTIPSDAKEFKVVLKSKDGTFKWEQAMNHSVKDATPQVIKGIKF